MRNPAVEDKIRWLKVNPNLPENQRNVAGLFTDTSVVLLSLISEDSLQLTIALQHLIDAKDAAVRASFGPEKTAN